MCRDCLSLLVIFLTTLCAAARAEHAPSPASAPMLLPGEVQSLLERVENDLRDLQSLQTSFEQEKRMAMFVEPVKASGVLLFQNPRQLRFEIKQPFHSVLIANTGSVARYEHMDGKWVKLRAPLGNAVTAITDQLALWMQGRLREAASAYEIQATAGPEPTILLSPVQPKMREFISLIELKLAFQPTRLTGLTIREPGGDYTHVAFLNEQRNKQIPAEYFATDLAEPADVAE